MKFSIGLFLILSGLINALPSFAGWTSGLPAVGPYLHLAIGIIAIVLGIWHLFAR